MFWLASGVLLVVIVERGCWSGVERENGMQRNGRKYEDLPGDRGLYEVIEAMAVV